MGSSKRKRRAKDSLPMEGWVKKQKVHMMPLKRCALSKEQQSFYELITESIVGSSESRRVRALQSMSRDASLQALLPKLSQFIVDATDVNICQKNIPTLIYLMRMVRALLGNCRLKLHKFLHLILPAVLSCLLTKQDGPGIEDHWILREYSGNTIAEIVRHFDSPDNIILPRVIEVYMTALHQPSLSTVFGAVIGLGKLGNYPVRAYIVPEIAYLSGLIEPHLSPSSDSTSTNLEKQASRYIRHRLVKACTPVLKSIRKTPDVPAEYLADYGILGEPLCRAVIVSRVKDMAIAAAKAQEAVAKSQEAARLVRPKLIVQRTMRIKTENRKILIPVKQIFCDGVRRKQPANPFPGVALPVKAVNGKVAPRILMPNRKAGQTIKLVDKFKAPQPQNFVVPPSRMFSVPKYNGIVVKPSNANVMSANRSINGVIEKPRYVNGMFVNRSNANGMIIKPSKTNGMSVKLSNVLKASKPNGLPPNMNGLISTYLGCNNGRKAVNYLIK